MLVRSRSQRSAYHARSQSNPTIRVKGKGQVPLGHTRSLSTAQERQVGLWSSVASRPAVWLNGESCLGLVENPIWGTWKRMKEEKGGGNEQ